MLPMWSNFQAEVQPLCRIEPRTSHEVAEIVRVASQHKCHFAVLGGGTSPFKGASNADGGITIDMRRMKDMSFVEGNDTHLIVGPGNLWADVYRKLDPLNMSATGTRNSLTGVVGSIWGGGISFFSEFHGWACDTVVEFEIVLANGTIFGASETTNTDLFRALRGRGNNFGIVTRVTIEVFRDPPPFYIFQLFDINDHAQVFDRLEKHTAQMPLHVCQIAVTLGWDVRGQHFVISERMVASEIPDLVQDASSSYEAGSGKKLRALQTNIYERSILAMAQKMDGMNEAGFFNFFGSTTVRNNALVAAALAKIFQGEVELIKSTPGLKVYIVYNPITVNAMRQMRKRGQNALGLADQVDPLIIININMHWSEKESEPQMRRFMRRLIGPFRAKAAEMDMLHPYIFQNHAFEEQDVFPGYGKHNFDKLESVRQEVEPEAVFQTLQPGGLKLWRQVPNHQAWKSEL